MKNLVFIYGPNSVGKSTVCRLVHKKLKKSAWLESEWARKINPFKFTPEIGKMTELEAAHIIINHIKEMTKCN